MSDYSWHKRFQGDAIAGYMGLTLEERGAYTTLLDHIYDRRAPLPGNLRLLAGLLDISVRKAGIVIESLVEKRKLYRLPDGKISNRRAEKELEISARSSDHRAEIGSRGGKKSAEERRKLKENNEDLQRSLENNSRHSRVQTPDTRKKEEDAGPSGPAAIAASGSKDDQTWVFNEGLQWLAKASGRKEPSLRSFIGKCRKALKNDDGQLRLAIEEASRQPTLADPTEWVAAAVKTRAAGLAAPVGAARPFPPRQAQPSMADALYDAQDQLARVFAKTGMWPPREGPKPGEKGCRIAPEVLARYGLAAPAARVPAET